MKIARYTFISSARWVTDSVCEKIKELGAEVELSRTGRNNLSGTITVTSDSEKSLSEVKNFIENHFIFRNHFTPVSTPKK